MTDYLNLAFTVNINRNQVAKVLTKDFKLFTKNNYFIINKIREYNLRCHLIDYANINISRPKQHHLSRCRKGFSTNK